MDGGADSGIQHLLGADPAGLYPDSQGRAHLGIQLLSCPKDNDWESTLQSTHLHTRMRACSQEISSGTHPHPMVRSKNYPTQKAEVQTQGRHFLSSPGGLIAFFPQQSHYLPGSAGFSNPQIIQLDPKWPEVVKTTQKSPGCPCYKPQAG